MRHIRHRFMTNVHVYQSSVMSYHMGHIHRYAYRVCPWLTSWHGNASTLLTLCERFLQKQRDIPHKGWRNPHHGCFFAVSLNKLLENKPNKPNIQTKTKPKTKQAVEILVICDTMMIMWGHCNVFCGDVMMQPHLQRYYATPSFHKPSHHPNHS